MDDQMVGMLMIGLFAVMIMMCMGGSPEQKTFDEKAQREIAKKVLAGADPEEVAKEEGCTVEDIEKWKGEYIQMAVKYANDAEKRGIADAQKDAELRWFEDTMRSKLGDDWKEKNGYFERDLLRYKSDPEQ